MKVFSISVCIVLLSLPLVRPHTQSEGDKGQTAVEELQRQLSKEDFAKALITIDQLLARDPNNHWLHNLRATTLQRAGREAEATASFQKALQLQASSSVIRLNLAINYLRLGRFGDAGAELTNLIGGPTVSPPPPNLYHQAPVGPELERFLEFLRAEEIQFSALGRLLLTHHLPEAAATVFSRGAERFPKSAELHYNRGWVLQELGRSKEAEAAFQTALELNPECYECCLRLGHSFAALGESSRAVSTYRRCVEVRPDHYSGYYFLGQQLMRGDAGEREEALSHLKRAVTLNPYSVDGRAALGKAYLSLGSLTEALRELTSAVRDEPDHEQAHYHLGMAYRQLGKTDQATQQLKRVEELKARTSVRRENMSGLISPSADNLEEVAGLVSRFYASYRQALIQRRYDLLWEMLTERSKTLYHDDFLRFQETLESLPPDLRRLMEKSDVTGGRVIYGRIICEFAPVDGARLPPLVLAREDDGLRLDYAFDLSLAGLARLGAR